MNVTTLTPAELVSFARSHVKLQPLVGIGGIPNEPGLTLANKAKRRIINRSYNWDWNRKTIPPFLTVNERDEYHLTVDDIGWLERARAEFVDSTAVPLPMHYVEIKRDMQRPYYKGRVEQVAIDVDKNSNPVVRLWPMPDTNQYRLYIDYQARAEKITEMDCPLSPLPEELDDIIIQFFLAYAYKLVDHQQFLRELREAENLLKDYLNYSSAEPTNVGFSPMDPIMIG